MDNSSIKLNITGLTHEGKGVGRHDGLAVFVKDALPGEIVRARLHKVKKNYAEAILEEILEVSPFRIDGKCLNHKKCGGCQLLHLNYREQLKEKQNIVINALQRIGGFSKVTVNECLGMDDPWGYRNKIIFQVGRKEDKEKGLKLGFYEENSNDFVPGKGCLLVSLDVRRLADKVEKLINVYNLKQLKRILIRQSTFNKEILLGLIFSGKTHDRFKLEKMVGEIKNHSDKLISIIEFIVADSKLPWKAQSKVLYGRDYFIEELNSKRFIISANSFFQVNSLQAEKLYGTVVEFVGTEDAKTIFDLYCGTGTIAIQLSDMAERVYGIETLEEALGDARRNADLNKTTNVEFLLGKAEVKAKKLFEKGLQPDVVVVDPPRKGCHPDLLNSILTVNPKKVIYVSCNPATLARDLTILSQSYTAKEVQPVDMFPHTAHVETVALMSKVEK
ncbi:MAG: hypothetical protein APF76_12370 [Desulfitibacter sp. BRH_c19]|nr:MAG: hypothetical protein APF76_12370 [Desulfitibacter sp. BRH_c19]